MRIWSEQLIPLLCRQHLLATWRESLGAYKIITQGLKGYINHPATKEFTHAPNALLHRLHLIRKEMLRRGYNPKSIPEISGDLEPVKEWQDLQTQVALLRSKGCQCKIDALL